jgi:hypothetical protein
VLELMRSEDAFSVCVLMGVCACACARLRARACVCVRAPMCARVRMSFQANCYMIHNLQRPTINQRPLPVDRLPALLRGFTDHAIVLVMSVGRIPQAVAARASLDGLAQQQPAARLVSKGPIECRMGR